MVINVLLPPLPPSPPIIPFPLPLAFLLLDDGLRLFVDLLVVVVLGRERRLRVPLLLHGRETREFSAEVGKIRFRKTAIKIWLRERTEKKREERDLTLNVTK